MKANNDPRIAQRSRLWTLRSLIFVLAFSGNQFTENDCKGITSSATGTPSACHRLPDGRNALGSPRRMLTSRMHLRRPRRFKWQTSKSCTVGVSW